MTYNPAIPQPGDYLSDSQAQILNNFAAANATYARNHISFSTSTNNGRHKFVEMVAQALPPSANRVASEGTLYTKTTSAITNLFYVADVTNNEYQLTRNIPTSFSKFSTSTALSGANGFGGWTFLPGGMLLQYGSFNPNTNTTVVFPVAFTSTPYSVQLTGENSNNTAYRAGITSGTLSNTQFVFGGSVDTHWTPIYFIAIGK